MVKFFEVSGGVIVVWNEEYVGVVWVFGEIGEMIFV